MLIGYISLKILSLMFANNITQSVEALQFIGCWI